MKSKLESVAGPGVYSDTPWGRGHARGQGRGQVRGHGVTSVRGHGVTSVRGHGRENQKVHLNAVLDLKPDFLSLDCIQGRTDRILLWSRYCID